MTSQLPCLGDSFLFVWISFSIKFQLLFAIHNWYSLQVLKRYDQGARCILFSPMNLADSTPQQNERSFAEWWRKTISRVSKEHRKGVNSLIILGAWIIWKHRNACVFEGVSPSLSKIWSELKNEQSLVHGWGEEASRAWFGASWLGLFSCGRVLVVFYVFKKCGCVIASLIFGPRMILLGTPLFFFSIIQWNAALLRFQKKKCQMHIYTTDKIRVLSLIKDYLWKGLLNLIP